MQAGGVLDLPVTFRNRRKIRYELCAPVGLLPTKILPLSKESEQTIVCQLIADLNSLHCLKLSDKPDLKRGMCLPTCEHGLRKLVLVGASHTSKMATLLGLDDQVSYLSLPAQTAQKACVDNIVAKLLELELTNKDVLILDIFSSTVLMGSDEMGMPCQPSRRSLAGTIYPAVSRLPRRES